MSRRKHRDRGERPRKRVRPNSQSQRLKPDLARTGGTGNLAGSATMTFMASGTLSGAVEAQHGVHAGVAAETDTALPLGGGRKSVPLGIATERDLALPVTAVGGAPRQDQDALLFVGQVINAWAEIEQLYEKLLQKSGESGPRTFRAHMFRAHIFRSLGSKGIEGPDIDDEHGEVFDKLRQIRNRVAHGDKTGLSANEMTEYLRLAEEMRAYLVGRIVDV